LRTGCAENGGGVLIEKTTSSGVFLMGWIDNQAAHMAFERERKNWKA
jgi:hypothetical protein